MKPHEWKSYDRGSPWRTWSSWWRCTHCRVTFEVYMGADDVTPAYIHKVMFWNFIPEDCDLSMAKAILDL